MVIDGSPALLYTTNLSTIVVLELRTMRVLRTFENPRHFGPITAACLDKNQSWLVIGTTTGVLTLWDLRFGLLLRSWSTASSSTLSTSNVNGNRSVHQIAVYPNKARERHIVVAVETTSPNASRSAQERAKGSITLEIWDIENARLEEVFITAEGALETGDTSPSASDTDSSTPPNPNSNSSPEIEKEGRVVSGSAAACIAELVRSRRAKDKAQEEAFRSADIVVDPDAPAHTWMRPDVRALLALSGSSSLAQAQAQSQGSVGGKQELADGSGGGRKGRGGVLLVGTESRRIQVWDLGNAERSVVLSGVDAEQGPPLYLYVNLPLYLPLHPLTIRVFDDRTTPGGAKTPASHTVTFPNPASAPTPGRGQSRSTLTAQQHQSVMKGHTDAVVALACIDTPFKGGIVSGDAAGAIKVFKIE